MKSLAEVRDSCYHPRQNQEAHDSVNKSGVHFVKHGKLPLYLLAVLPLAFTVFGQVAQSAAPPRERRSTRARSQSG